MGEDYEPAVVTASEGREIHLKYRDERTTESEYVTMPDSEDD